MEGCDLMGLKDNSEIEQIQRGLEAFLEKELKSDKGAEGQEGEDFLEEYQRIGGLLEEKKVGKPYKKGGLQVIGQGGERLSDRTRLQRAGQGAGKPEGMPSGNGRSEGMPSRPGNGRPEGMPPRPGNGSSGGEKYSRGEERVPGRPVYPGKGDRESREWNPGEDSSRKDWYPEEGSSRENWYPEEGSTQEDWYSEEGSTQKGWYPEEGSTQEDWYPEEESTQEEWYSEEGSSQEDWYSEKGSSQENWYPEEEISQEDWHSQERVSREQGRSPRERAVRDQSPGGGSPSGVKRPLREKSSKGENTSSAVKRPLREKSPEGENSSSAVKRPAREKTSGAENSSSGKKRQAKKNGPVGESSPVQKGQGAEQKETPMAKKTTKSQKSSMKKPRRKKSLLLRLLIICCVIVALLGFGLYHVVGSVHGKMTFEEIEAVAAQPMEEDGVVNILLIGNDSRKNGTDGRSDAMILLSISNRTKTIYMTSILRDIYVDIPGREGNRLNAAYSFGGPELLMETIEKNFDISVNRYVSVNFEAFANLIDAVGGVDLELSSQEIESVNGSLVEYNMLTGREQGTDNMDPAASGMVHLNGPQALAYSRNRYIGTDFGRTERQRKVLTAAVEKLPSALLNDAEGLMDKVLPNLTTNLTQNECFQLSLMAGKLLTYEIVSDSIPQPGTYKDVTIRKMAVLEVDFEANIRYLKEKIYGETEEGE